MSVLKDGSTSNTDGIDLKHLPSSPIPPLAPKHLKIFTCCCLEYSITDSLGTLGAGLGVRGKEEKAYNQHNSLWFKAEGNRGIPEAFQLSWPSWGRCSPRGTHSSQLETAESFQQVMCTYLLVRNNSHSLLRPSFPCFPLLSDLLPTVKCWSNADSLGKLGVEPASHEGHFISWLKHQALCKRCFLFLKDHRDTAIPLTQVNSSSRTSATHHIFLMVLNFFS